MDDQMLHCLCLFSPLFVCLCGCVGWEEEDGPKENLAQVGDHSHGVYIHVQYVCLLFILVSLCLACMHSTCSTENLIFSPASLTNHSSLVMLMS